MKKSRPPAVSVVVGVLRILLSLALPLLVPFTVPCAAVYAVCGLLRVVSSDSTRREQFTVGSEGLNILADCFFVAASLITFLPEMDIPTEYIMIGGVILAVKAATLLSSVLKFKRPLLLSTYLNRAALVILFLVPLVWQSVSHELLLKVLSAVAGLGAVEELAITLISHYPRPNRRAFIQKRHIKHVLYGAFQKRAAALRERSGVHVPVSNGINFIGELSGSTAKAECSRLVESMLGQTGVPVFCDDHPSTKKALVLKRITRVIKERRRHMPYDISLLCIDPFDLPELCVRRGAAFFKDNYIIGYWLWEQPSLPSEYKRCLDLVDEIWTPSEFVSSAVRECTSKPVHTVPYTVAAQPDSSLDREHFGLPENKLLYMINVLQNSEWERKNPVGAARAFASAFPDGMDNVGLIVKAPGAGRFERNEIKSAVGFGNRVYFFTKEMDKTEADSLLSCTDALISLHRGESFGMTMAQAMLLGKPVIASAWSANTEYMDSECACLVDCSPAELEYEYEPYHKGTVWGEPDENKAAGFIRQMYDDEEKRLFIGRLASERIADRFGPEKTVAVMKSRISELFGEGGGR